MPDLDPSRRKRSRLLAHENGFVCRVPRTTTPPLCACAPSAARAWISFRRFERPKRINYRERPIRLCARERGPISLFARLSRRGEMSSDNINTSGAKLGVCCRTSAATIIACAPAHGGRGRGEDDLLQAPVLKIVAVQRLSGRRGSAGRHHFRRRSLRNRFFCSRLQSMREESGSIPIRDRE